MRVHRPLTAAAVAVTAVLVPLAEPASAGVIVSTSGTTITVTITGGALVRVGCRDGHVTVNTATATPNVACSTFTQLTVTGDENEQAVRGDDLDASAFAAHPHLEAVLGDGIDTVTGSAAADDLDLGAGADDLRLSLGGAVDTLLDLGPDRDQFRVTGTSSAESIALAASSPTLTIGVASSTWTVLDVEGLEVEALGGDDTIDASGITAAAPIDDAVFLGGDGDDSFVVGDLRSYGEGSAGTNTFHGGPFDDLYVSSSPTDVVDLGGGTLNELWDQDDLRSGGRTASGTGTTDRYRLRRTDGRDDILRVRPGAVGGTSVLTNSLSRTGQQQLPANFARLYVENDGDRKLSRMAVDLVAVAQEVTVAQSADDDDDEVVDITIPTGTWTQTTTSGVVSVIDPTTAGLGTIRVFRPGPVSVHGPWTDRNQGFGHRVVRDLYLRIATTAERTSIATSLASGTRTRTRIVRDLMAADGYRGLDVDRTFRRYLDRSPDPAGRAYWIASLRNGRSLRQFRAQLFGSREYYLLKGSSPDGYVRSAYADVLGRAPDPAGLAYWVDRLSHETERGSIAKQFLASTEARRSIVEDQYLRFLDRLPTADESTAWVRTLGSQAQGEQQLIEHLAASAAYFTRT